MRGHHSTLQVETILQHLASRQLGPFTRAQALSAGISDSSLQRRVEVGLLRRLHPGVFVSGVDAPTFVQRCVGACLAVDGATLTGTAAAFVHGLPVREPLNPELSLPTGKRFFGSGVDVRRTTRPLATRPWFTGRITTPSATIIAVAAQVDQRVLSRCIDHALASRLITIERILADVHLRAPQGFSGRRQLVEELLLRTGGSVRHRSNLERRVGGWLSRAGLGGWQPNHTVVTGGRPVEVDFAWPQRRVALEVSPFFTHGSKDKQENDARRRRSLIASGWTVVEATDPNLADFITFGPIVSLLRDLLR